jgi:hypothetical protein
MSLTFHGLLSLPLNMFCLVMLDGLTPTVLTPTVTPTLTPYPDLLTPIADELALKIICDV